MVKLKVASMQYPFLSRIHQSSLPLFSVDMPGLQRSGPSVESALHSTAEAIVAGEAPSALAVSIATTKGPKGSSKPAEKSTTVHRGHRVDAEPDERFALDDE